MRTMLFTVQVLVVCTCLPVWGAGRVLVVFGSDCATGGLNTAKYVNTVDWNYAPVVSPTGNLAVIMSDSYRNAHRDSQGNPAKFTWYIMAGSLYSHMTNATSIFPFDIMLNSQGHNMTRWGDEIALHYHTWIWNDPESDGVFSWNMAPVFAPCQPDFEASLSRLILERGIYPTAFRSGWNVMDNDWEVYLSELFPHRSESPINSWVPYHPSRTDYRVPGDLPGWETRHIYTKSVTQAVVNGVFTSAAAGADQVMVIWSHYYETDYPAQFDPVQTYLDTAHAANPEVEFLYVTAREAFLLWRQGNDTTPPELTVNLNGSTVEITSNEPIYQSVPYLAVEKKDGSMLKTACSAMSPLSWTAVLDEDTFNAAVGVCDGYGNPATAPVQLPLMVKGMTITPGSTTATVSWETNAPAVGLIRYGITPAYGSSVAETTAVRKHEVILTNLLPHTLYYLEIESVPNQGSPITSERQYFTTNPAEDIIIDNPDSGFSCYPVWSTGSTAVGRYGNDYRYVNTAPTGTSLASWRPAITTPGNYRVYVWWSQGTNRSTQAPYTVNYSGGSQVFLCNQQDEGGKWNLLGTFPFAAGTSGSVTLGNAAETGFVVIADAVRFQMTGTTYTQPVYQGWNLVSLPADPADANPLVIFSGIDIANSSLQFWNNSSDGGGYQNYGRLFSWTGPIVRGTPYWFLESTPTSGKRISFVGYPSNMDFELTIPPHGEAPFWIMFGTPFPVQMSTDAVRFKNVSRRGDAWLTWEEAFSQESPDLRIVDSNAQAWVTAQNCFVSVTPSSWTGRHVFDPWFGYWLLVYDTNELKIKLPKP